MSLVVLELVLVSAALHATWNLLLKQVGGSAPFTWLCDIVTLLLLAPVIAAQGREWPSTTLPFIAVSGILEVAYMLCLQRGYRAGDFSVVYPVARGIGPILVALAAPVALSESWNQRTMLGTGCVLTGVGLLTGLSSILKAHSARATMYGCLTGLWIASYTLWDKWAMAQAGIAPLVLYYGKVLVRAFVLAPVAVQRSGAVRSHWQRHRPHALSIAVMSTVSYVLFLSALERAPATAVAPLREVSIAFSVFMGTRLLGETATPRRYAAVALIAVGVTLIATRHG